MTAILDNLKRIYWEVSNASLCFELTIEEIIKFTDIQEIILNTMETDLLLLIESIDGRRSIKEIVEIIGLSYQDKSRINFECISTILQLIKEGVLYPLKLRVVTE